MKGGGVGIVDILGDPSDLIVVAEHLPALLAEGRREVGRLELRVGSSRGRGEGGGHRGGDGPQSLLRITLRIKVSLVEDVVLFSPVDDICSRKLST